VGVCTSAVLAYKNPSIEIIVVDRSESTISAWNSDNIPISEPGLKTILRKITSSKCEPARDKQNSPMQEDQQRPHPQLRFSTDIKGGIRGAELIFICVDTPIKKNSHGDNADIETKSVEACVKTIIDVSISNKIIVEKSTVSTSVS
jgi:UDPglucose 6-dehydrogenase